MKKMRCIRLACLAMALLILAGCYTSVPPADTDPDDTASQDGDLANTPAPVRPPADVRTLPIPEENIDSISKSSFSAMCVPGDHYYCLSGQRIMYVDIATGLSSFCCVQTGCKHEDATCQAFYSGLQSFLVYKGMWYCLCKTEDEAGYTLIRTDPANNQRTVLAEWIPENEDEYYDITYMTAAYGKLYLPMTLYSSKSTKDDICSLDCLDLETGEILECAFDLKNHSICACAPDGVVLVKTFVPEYVGIEGSEQLDKDLEEYNEQHHTYLTFPIFQQMHTYNELGLLDMRSGEYTKLLDSVEDGYWPTSDPCSVYGNLYIYQCHDTIYLYDLETGVSQEVITEQNISNYFILDGKPFYITATPDEEHIVYIWYVDLEDGVPVRMYNQGSTEYMIYSAVQESDNYVSNNRSWITKEDFYTNY